jgi:glyoxylase-like metal-dependent hydrolase (beta-lactamase superfamily II)
MGDSGPGSPPDTGEGRGWAQAPVEWSDGVCLVGTYEPIGSGCWLLHHHGVGAVVDMPPFDRRHRSPAEVLGECTHADPPVDVRYLVCTHAHWDHFDPATLRAFLATFPRATLVLEAGFREQLPNVAGIDYFTGIRELDLGGEPLYLIAAPKHSWTDTMVVFRGVIITGDWELNTLRSVHDGRGGVEVPREVRLASIERLRAFQRDYRYRIHKVYSVHADDRREGIDFDALMADTRVDRKLW